MEYINDVVKQIVTLGPAALTVACCIAIGYVIRMLPISNRSIPAICPVVGAILYSAVAKTGDVNPDIHNPVVAQAMIGFILGFVAWMGHKALLSKLEEKFPSLKTFLDGDVAAWPPATPPSAGPLPLLLVAGLGLAFAGCATFSSHVTDVQPDGSRRETVTKVATFFDSKTELAKMKASQSSKDAQTISLGSLTQESSGTNAVELFKAGIEGAVQGMMKVK